jgi:hypothetical protein
MNCFLGNSHAMIVELIGQTCITICSKPDLILDMQNSFHHFVIFTSETTALTGRVKTVFHSAKIIFGHCF